MTTVDIDRDAFDLVSEEADRIGKSKREVVSDVVRRYFKKSGSRVKKEEIVVLDL